VPLFVIFFILAQRKGPVRRQSTEQERRKSTAFLLRHPLALWRSLNLHQGTVNEPFTRRMSNCGKLRLGRPQTVRSQSTANAVRKLFAVLSLGGRKLFNYFCESSYSFIQSRLFSNSRGLVPSGGPTIPSRSIKSMR